MIKITDSIVIYDTPDFLEVCGRDLAASDIIPFIGARKKLCLMADRFHLNGSIALPEGDVLVAARHILGGEGASIDVSGVNGRDAPSTQKPKPINADSPPPDGENGPAVGGNAGQITLIALTVDGNVSLTAAGGRGSKGQPGGNAADGPNGMPDNKERNVGGNGGNAGPIGSAGASRDSGNGGAIRIFVDAGIGTITSSVLGGPEVPAVSHGKPGQPGAAGRGGKEWHCEFIEDPKLPKSLLTGQSRLKQMCWPTGKKHPDGKPGAESMAPKNPPVAGLKGQDGTVTIDKPSLHGTGVPLRGLRLLLLEAEMLHIQATGSVNDAQEAMIAAREMAGFVFVLCLGSTNPAVAEIAARATALMHRISAGSPPEGTRGLEVSLTPLPQLLDSLKTSLESRWRGLAYIEPLKADTRDEEQVRQAISQVRSQVALLRSEGDGRLHELKERRCEVVRTINELSSNFYSVWKAVQSAENDFQEAVASQNPCANFLNAVIVVATVAVTVMSAGSATAGAIAAGSEILAYVAEDQKSKEAFDAKIKEAGGLKTRLDGYAKGAKDLADNAVRLKEMLGGDALTPPEDHVRVGMSREDFNKMIEPYRGMGATEKLKGLMDSFFSLTETRNSLLLEHDQIVIETASVLARTESAQQQLNEMIDKDGAALIDATIEAYEAALWVHLEAGKRLMGQLQAANRAFEYQALMPRPMNLFTTRGDNLEDEFSRLVKDAALTRPDELRHDATCEITISYATHPETFLALRDGRNAVVSLMPEHVPPAQKERWDERAYALGIKINGIKASRLNPVTLSGRMVSCGIAWFRKRDGQQISMRIPMRDAGEVVVSTALDPDEVRASRNMIGTDSATVDASPYGLWRIWIPGIEFFLKDKNGKVDEKALEKISLTFCFIGTARISYKVAALVDRRRGELLPRLPRPTFDALELAGPSEERTAALDQERVSVVTDRRESWTGSPLEDAMLVRMVEDMIYTPTYCGPKPDNRTEIDDAVILDHSKAGNGEDHPALGTD